MSGIDKYTVAMLHFDESVIEDECGNTWSTLGSPQISTTQSKFGGNSLYLNGSSAITTPMSNFESIKGNDFTVDFWVYYPSAQGWRDVFSFGRGYGGTYLATSRIQLGYYSHPTESYYGLNIQFYDKSLTYTDFTAGYWHHIAYVVSGKTAKIYVDGSLVGSITIDSYNSIYEDAHFSDTFKLGYTVYADGSKVEYMNGHIDEFRISNIARWTSDFTPPTSPYSHELKLYVDSNKAVWGMKA